jgi:hypothetical protein
MCKQRPSSAVTMDHARVGAFKSPHLEWHRRPAWCIRSSLPALYQVVTNWGKGANRVPKLVTSIRRQSLFLQLFFEQSWLTIGSWSHQLYLTFPKIYPAVCPSFVPRYSNPIEIDPTSRSPPLHHWVIWHGSRKHYRVYNRQNHYCTVLPWWRYFIGIYMWMYICLFIGAYICICR